MSKKLDDKHLKKNKFEVHLITLGDSAVGKTSLIGRYINNNFSNNYISTFGADSQFKKTRLQNGQEIKVRITDTAGQERYHAIAANYIKKANGILLVYDITNKDSFENVNKWAQEIRENSEDSIPIVLIGNKLDLEEERRINKEQGEEFAKKYCDGGIKFYETSCKTGENVCEAINDLAEQIYKKFFENDLNEGNDVQLGDEKNGKKRKCC